MQKYKKDRNIVNSIVRAINVLECFDKNNKELKLIEIAQMTSLDKSSVHRLLHTLISCGYIKQNEDNERYSLGNKALVLGLKALDSFDLRTFALPYLQELVNKSQETSNLAILQGDKMIYLASIDSPRAVRLHNDEGILENPHTSAVGKILLSSLDDKQIKEYSKKSGLKKRTKNSISTYDELIKEINKVRKDGIAYDLEEDDLDMICIGGPIYDRFGKIVAGMSISGPANRVKPKLNEFSKLVKKQCELLSKELGY